MRDVLAHAVGYRELDSVVSYATRLAASLHAALTAMYILPAMPALAALPSYDVPSVLAEYANWIEREIRSARAAAPEFEAWATSMGATRPRWEVADGEVAAVLRHVGHWHDLLVLGIGGVDPWRSVAATAELVLSSGLPCLLVPPVAAGGDVRHACIAVAWNGAIEGIGALHAALPLLQSADRVVVLAGAPAPHGSGLVRFDLDRWVDRHGVHIEYLMLDTEQDPGSALLAASQEVSADLLVAGAYGRSRLAEWILGGVTRHLLQHSRIPLLVRH